MLLVGCWETLAAAVGCWKMQRTAQRKRLEGVIPRRCSRLSLSVSSIMQLGGHVPIWMVWQELTFQIPKSAFRRLESTGYP